MKNHYLLTVEDSDPAYHGTYLLYHPTRSAQDLKMDYEVLLDLHMNGDENCGWSVGDVIRSLQKLGWKVIDIPEVKVAY